MAKTIIRTEETPGPVGLYSPAVRAGDFVFISGQIGIDPVKKQLVSESVGDQIEQCFINLGIVLKAAGLGLEHIVKTTVLMTDMADYPNINEAYGKRFPSDPPARAAFAAAALPLGAKVEIEAIAYTK